MADRYLAVVTLVRKLGEGEGSPEHPIVMPPEQPPEVWPPSGVVSPPIYYPPTVWPPQPGRPAHPIARPPVFPAHPIFNPGSPEHPIVLPPTEGPPPEVWPPSGPLPTPEHPMVPDADAIFVVGYSPGYGVCWVKVKPEPIEEQPSPKG
jgi:hypothetical protein